MFAKEKILDSKALKKLGLKITIPRMKILKILEQQESHHFSAEEVYRILKTAGDDVGLATVYRVLTQFESAGLVTSHNFEGGYSVFELNQGEHHDHLVCVKCGNVEEFIDDLIEQRQREIAEKSGYQMTDHSLNIYGICAKCISKDSK